MHVNELLDHHMHSEFSEDSKQPIEELVVNAINDGKKYLTITDHSDLIFAKTTRNFCADIEAYDKEITRLQAKYPEITLLRGTEVGFEASIIDEIQEFFDKHQFDIRVMSIHSAFDGKDFACEFRDKGEWIYSDDVVKDYYEATLQAVKLFPSMQILGHLDYLFRYVPNGERFDLSPYTELLQNIFAELIKNDIALDLNTAGLRYGLPYFHPQPQLLKMYKEAGGTRLTLGSDAHFAKDVNYGFGPVLNTLEELGFTEITTFETGEPVQILISSIER